MRNVKFFISNKNESTIMVQVVSNGETKYVPIASGAYLGKSYIQRTFANENAMFDEYRFSIVDSQKTNQDGKPYKNILISAITTDGKRIATVSIMKNAYYVWNAIDNMLKAKQLQDETQTTIHQPQIEQTL